jgi:hypothetical protein
MEPKMNATSTERKAKPNLPPRMLAWANRITKVMEEVRLDACGSQKMNHLWVMDMLYDVRLDIYHLRNVVKNTSKPDSHTNVTRR